MTIDVPANFTPRAYQIPVYNSLSEGYKRIDYVAPRRSGKDKVMISMVGKEMLKRVGTYFYIFPTYTQGKKVLWDGRDKDGFRTLEHIPRQIWQSENATELSVTVKNGSKLQIVGSENVDTLVGTNPLGIVFSEWSLQDPIVWAYMKPILEENGGWAMFNYTPRGDNHAKAFHDRAREDNTWFSQLLTLDDTRHIPEEEWERIRQEYIAEYGDDALYHQEFWCSFEAPVQGSYYGKQIQQAEREGRVLELGYDASKLVFTAWDLGGGKTDSTSIVFYQKVGEMVNVIDFYEIFQAGMGQIAEVLRTKGYSYDTHYLPHDGGHKVQGRGTVSESRQEMLQSLLPGQNFVVLPRSTTSVIDEIMKVKGFIAKCKFDSVKCERLVRALKEYGQEWDEKRKDWKPGPRHDWSSHPADAFRYMVNSYKAIARLDDSFEPVRLYKPNSYI